MDDGGLGTSLTKVTRALEQVLDRGEALVLADLGSAVLVTQMAIEVLSPEQQERVCLANAPLVEGAIAAVVAAAGGGDLQTVRDAAERALEMPKIPSEGALTAPEVSVPPTAAGPMESVELPVLNPSGLHARPAALFVRTAMRFKADITVQNVTHGRAPANAKSMMDVATQGTAWQGEWIRIVAQGEDAAEAIATLRQLVDSGFGEMEEPTAPTLSPAAVSAPVEVPVAGQLRGIPASEGIAVAPALLYRPRVLEIERRQVPGVAAEIERLHTALQRAKDDLTLLEQQLAEQDADVARIFQFQRMMLEDPLLVQAIETEIRRNACNAEGAVDQVIGEWVARFEQMDSELMRLRSVDVRDVGNRVLYLLQGVEEPHPLSTLPEPVVLVARDLTPSDTARLDRSRVRGLCTAAGGATSHVAILARMWNLPAVVGLGDALLQVQDGVLLAMDGETGVVEVDPAPAMVNVYRQREAQWSARQTEALRQIGQLAITQDGRRVEVVANVGDVQSAREALEYGAEGIGLLRSEFLYLDRNSLPDEEEQVEVYRAIAKVMGQRPVIVRTLDVGGDKPLPSIPRPTEANPAMGVRAIRLSRMHPDLLRTQLRAILRAGAGHNVKVMFPLVTTVTEVRWAKALLRQVQQELAAEGVEHAPDIEIGVMVETPAAALMAGALAAEVDFFSIGSNDLVQYTLACDRGNERLGDLYHPLDPAVLRLIALTIEAAHARGKWVGLCGEMAGQRMAIPLLLGLGLDEFSMTPRAIPEAKRLIRSMRLSQARQIADHVLTLSTAAEVSEYLGSVVNSMDSLPNSLVA